MRVLIVAALVACSSPSWKRPELAETLRVENELIVRYEPDDTISVTAQVSLGEVRGSGHVLLRRDELATAAKSKHVRLARARAWYALAVSLTASPELALQAATSGWEEIRRAVRIENRISQSVSLAVMNNDVPGAARIMTESLQFSLRSYVRRFHEDVW